MLPLAILFNGALIVFIVSTMFAAGLTTAVADLLAVLRRGRLLVLVLVANLVVVPLLGLGVAEVFGLTAAASAALILVASSPGAPFGAKVAMIQRGDVLTGSVVQALLAALGSVTFPITANALLTRAGGPGDLNLPVADLLLSVAVLQLVPFGIGLAMKHWTGQTSAGWAPVTQRVSTMAFGAVLVLGLASSWEQLVSLIGSRTLIAAAVFSVLAGLAGALLSPGRDVRAPRWPGSLPCATPARRSRRWPSGSTTTRPLWPHCPASSWSASRSSCPWRRGWPAPAPTPANAGCATSGRGDPSRSAVRAAP